jgi:CheY-like chemotaxis protein
MGPASYTEERHATLWDYPSRKIQLFRLKDVKLFAAFRIQAFDIRKRICRRRKKRVLLVDDSALIRRAVRPFFDSHPNVVGEAEHGREAVEKAPILQPDLVVLDLSMPVMNGLEAAPLLINILPNVWLILFTAHDGPEVEQLSRASGIHAVVPKSKAATHLIAQAEDRLRVLPASLRVLAASLLLAFVFRELQSETLLCVGDPSQGGHRNVK